MIKQLLVNVRIWNHDNEDDIKSLLDEAKHQLKGNACYGTNGCYEVTKVVEYIPKSKK